ALDDAELLVDPDEPAGGRLVEADAERQGEPAPVSGPRRHLPGQARAVALVGHHAAGERELLAVGPGRHGEMPAHVVARPIVNLLLGERHGVVSVNWVAA